MIISGCVEQGMKKGAYYVEQFSDRFREKIGFYPFPGTLNVRLKTERDIEARKEMDKKEHVLIEPFEQGGKSFVQVKCYPCTINNVKGVVVVPGRTDHPPEVIEVIAEASLRETLSIKDGDCVTIEIF